MLPDAPSSPWNGDELRLGTFRGECATVDIDGRYGRVARVRAQKRWLWCGAMDDDVAVAIAIVRTGYAANVFCWVFDRQRKVFLEDISRIAPRFAVDVASTVPEQGRVASYRMVTEKAVVERKGGRWRLDANLANIRLDLEFEEDGPGATAICPTPRDGAPNVTRKHARAHATGVIRVGTERFRLDGHGMLDHSHGMLSGETVWNWAIGSGEFDDGEPVAFNLVAGFNDQLENVIWLGSEPSFAGRVDFAIPAEHDAAWKVRSERFDLSMLPEALREQELDLGLVASDYVQPLGVWEGTIDGRAVRCLGVAELHRSVW